MVQTLAAYFTALLSIIIVSISNYSKWYKVIELNSKIILYSQHRGDIDIEATISNIVGGPRNIGEDLKGTL